jgi:transportin-3
MSPSWRGKKRNLLSKFPASVEPVKSFCCLQEVSNYRVAVRPERRRQAERELQDMLEQVLATMEAALNHANQSGGPAVTEEVLRAFSQWMQVTRGQGMSAEALRQHKLVRTTYEGLQTVNDSVIETAADGLEELVYCSVFMSNDGMPQPRSGFEQLIMVLFSFLVS